jgi:hypothetical protein
MASTSTEFEDWLGAEFARTGEFTALIVLVGIGEREITPLCSTHVDVIGTEIDWAEMTVLLAGAGVPWDGAAFFVATAEDGGRLPNVAARLRLRELEAAVRADRLHLNEGHFFDRQGRRMRVDEVDDPDAGHA